MRVEFDLSGGYGGLFAKAPLAYRIDTKDLPAETREKLLGMIQGSGLLEGRIRSTAGNTLARDTFSYRISLRDADRTAELTCDDLTAPEAVRPLLGFLKNLAFAER